VTNQTDDHNGWHSFLLSSKGPTDRSIADALAIFDYHPEMAGRLAYDVFAKKTMATAELPWSMRGKYPRALEDSDGTNATGWLEREGLKKLNPSQVKDCLVTISRRHPYNPLVDWLTGLEWDGQERIGKWLSYYLGAEPTDYTAAIGPKFLISAAARALKPGCKVDTMLILEGPQGRFKSTAARTLFGAEWYTDDLADLHSKDAALQMQGRWGIEISELSAMSRSESNRIKAVLSRQVDRFRAPYDRFVAEHPRQCVFIGTTNPVDGYFRDPTGARRFWPVNCGTIDVGALAHDREQLWAEAAHCFERGDSWWLDGGQIDHAKAQQEDRREVDPWEVVITRRLGGERELSVTDILREWLSVTVERQGKGEQMRVAAILRSLGWERKLKRVNGKPERVWVKDADESGFSGFSGDADDPAF
jgi:putative DNA primase/helicase